METGQSILNFARRFFAGTICSRISGFVRDVIMAVCFGGAPEVAAFMVAYRLANLFRRLLGEGSTFAGLVPHFTETEGKKAAYFYRDCFFSFACILAFVVFVLEGSLWGLSKTLSRDWSEIVLLSMKMLPGLVFICFYAINAAFLQAHKRYFMSGFAPVMFNACWICFALLGKKLPVWEAMNLLSIGIACAFFCQWAITLKQVQGLSLLRAKEWLRPKLFSPEWKRVIRPVLLPMIGVGALQVNSALDAIFARFADLSGPLYLWYAIRIQQLPLALFGIALSGALLPSLARAFKEGALDRYVELFKQALRYSAAILVPCMFGIFCLGGPGLNLLYGHGDFLSVDIVKTLHCLWGYGLGLVPSVWILLMGTAFYAQKSYGTPTLISVASIAIHLVANVLLVFVFKLGAVSIALSTSVSAIFNCYLLAIFMQKRLQVSVFSDFWKFFFQLCFIGIFASIVTLSFGYLVFDDPSMIGNAFPRMLKHQALQMCSMGSVFILSFACLSYWMGLKEVFEILKKEKAPAN